LTAREPNIIFGSSWIAVIILAIHESWHFYQLFDAAKLLSKVWKIVPPPKVEGKSGVGD